MKIEFDFRNKTEREKDKLIGEGYAYLVEAAKQGRNIKIDDVEEGKSGKQLRGYWRLIGLIQPFIEEGYGIKGKDEISSFIKRQNNFLKEIKTKKGTIFIEKSLTKATKQDLMNLIEKIYFICEFYEIKDYELKPQEQRDIENYFGV